ncbi:MAG: hypothetical protein ACI4RO_00705 [Candidatus Scatosoma sp.]
MLYTLLASASLTPFKWENIKPTFTILWQGLVAIFVVIGLIILAVQLVSWAVRKAEKAKKAREEKANASQGTSDAPEDEAR